MITSKGVQLLGKYLVGQLPTYASHIAVGCGESALINSESFGDYSDRTSLTFETARVPITSRTINIENGVTEVVFAAELPISERYAITEVGVYPSERNNAPGTEDSRILYGFQQSDGWLSYDATDGTKASLPIKQTRLDSASTGNIDVTETFFQTYPDNATFLFENRLNRQEQPRYLNNAVIIRGDSSLLDNASSLPASAQDHLQITGVDLSFLDKATPISDEIRLAFSVINTNLSGANPSRVQIMVEFTNNEAYSPATYARLIFNKTGGSPDNYDYSNRYIVASSTLANLSKSNDFTWSSVSMIKIYVDVDNSSSYYVALDALSFENMSSIDAQYGLAGYTIIKNQSTSAQPRSIIKYDNELSLIEFKFALDVG